MMDEPKTPDPTGHSGTHGSAVAGFASVVLVRFKSRRAAERMVSLGRDFRKNAHRGKAERSLSSTIRTVHSNLSSPVC
jgi:hypothetical protein